jgi:hypothetical protein
MLGRDGVFDSKQQTMLEKRSKSSKVRERISDGD